jgi:hypothetical protein
MRDSTSTVMAGLDPAIHDWATQRDVDARDKPGHDVGMPSPEADARSRYAGKTAA